MQSKLISGAVIALSVAGAAHADPCRAIPDQGPVPAYLRPGNTFSGPVVRVLDGDSLCVAVGQGPNAWVEVRLADFYAPESSETGGDQARMALEEIALGKDAVCKAGKQSYDRVVGSCRIAGRSVGDMMRQAGVAEGGRGYGRSRPPPVQSASSPRHVAVSSTSAAGRLYRDCAEARAAGAAPLYRGQPGYSPSMDGDGDGVACEPYRGRR